MTPTPSSTASTRAAHIPQLPARLAQRRISAVPLTMHAVVDSGQFGARAIAETLFGHNNPGGKLPYTFYKSSFISKISMDEFGCAKPPGTTLAQCCWLTS